MNSLLNNININNINKKDKQLIVSSNIKQIYKNVFPTCGKPSTLFHSIKSFEIDLMKQLEIKKSTLLFKNNNSNNSIDKKFKLLLEEELNPLEIKEFKQHKYHGKENDYLNSKLSLKNDVIANNIKDIYVIIDKFFLKKDIIKVSFDSPKDKITSIDCMALNNKVIQFIYKEEEKYFKKKSIGIHKSPYGAIRSINDIKYDGFSTIITFDNFIVCSFGIEKIELL